MKKLQKPREIPRKTDGTPNPIYFELEVDGIESRWFRLPNDRIVLDLVTLFGQFATITDSITFRGSIDALAAIVGAFWWDPDYELEAQVPKDPGGWMAFGGEVLEELHEMGFGGTSHVTTWAEALVPRLGTALISPEKLADFGAARKDSGTLSDWTSA